MLKGAVVGIDIFNPIASVAVFQYNPERLLRSVAPQYSQTGGGQTEALHLQGPPRETISAEIVIDLIDQMERARRVRSAAGSRARRRCRLP